MQVYAPVLEKYSRQATRYDRRWNRNFGEGTLEATIAAVPWKRAQKILDVGCGTGLLEATVRGRLHPRARMVGLDISLAMLEQAREKVNGAQGIRWANAVAESLPFPGACFDAVICANSFHYYRHPMRVLEEFRRVLEPGGWLVLTDWCADFLACKLGHWALQLADRTRLHRYAMQRCYDMEELEQMLAQAGFRIEMTRRVRMDWSWGVMVHRARA